MLPLVIRKICSINARQWKMVGVVFIALLAAGPVWFVIYDFTGRAAWEKYSAAERSRGVKLSITEFTPTAIPDEQNFGALPIFRNSLAINYRFPEFPSDTSSRERWLPAPEGGFLFRAELWRNWLAKAGWIDTPSADAAGDLRLALVRYDDVMNELAEGLKRPYCSFGITWAPNPFKTSLPYIQICQRAAFVATLRANAHLVSGNSETALQDLRFIAALRSRLAQEPSTPPAMARTVMGRQLVITIYEGLSRHAWKAAQLRELMELLSMLDPVNDMTFWIESERTMMNDWSEWILKGNVPMTNASLEYNSDPHTWFQNIRVLRAFPGIVRRNQLVVNRNFGNSLSKIDLVNGIDWSGQRGHDLPESPYYVITSEISEYFNRDRKRLLALATNFRLARAACALELYRHRCSLYPQTLADLTPDYLRSVPREPLSNDTLVYCPTDDGRYRLYSRGFNQENDNGVVRRLGSYQEDRGYLRSYEYLDDVSWIAPPAL